MIPAVDAVQGRRVVFDTLRDLDAALGTTIGPGSWLSVDQARIQLFADATNDQQWIHVDTERAAAGPFETTIAHGYLTLSLIPHFLAELVDVRGAGMGVNYGLNKARLPAPVPSGARLRATMTVAQVLHTSSGTRVTFEVTVEADTAEPPVCVAQVLVLYTPQPSAEREATGSQGAH